MESFSLDHTRIKAPYLRLSKAGRSPRKRVRDLDVRLQARTPNTELLTPKVTHSLEHLFAVALRAEFEEHQRDLKVLDVSPMGCRTGYYLTVLNPVGALPLSRATEVVTAMLPGALEIKELPGARLETCGAYKEHDFAGARAEIRRLSSEVLVPLDQPPLLL